MECWNFKLLREGNRACLQGEKHSRFMKPVKKYISINLRYNNLLRFPLYMAPCDRFCCLSIFRHCCLCNVDKTTRRTSRVYGCSVDSHLFIKKRTRGVTRITQGETKQRLYCLKTKYFTPYIFLDS